MRQFKKKTIALVLASVVTVVGAFGAENYKNSIMSLKFDSGSPDSVKLTVSTKKDYAGKLNLVKRDAGTYVLILPDTNCEIKDKVTLGHGVQNYSITTMPYTTSSNGYTKITIKTLPNILLQAEKALYVTGETPAQIETAESSNPPEAAPQEENMYEPIPVPVYDEPVQEPVEYREQERPSTIHSQSGVAQTGSVDIRESVRQFEPGPEEESYAQSTVSEEESSAASNVPAQSSGNDIILFVLGFLLIGCIIIFLFIRAQNSMKDLLGEQEGIDFTDDAPKAKKTKKEKKKKEKTNIKKAVRSLDKMYTKPEKMPVSMITDSVPAAATTPAPEIEEEPNIVDLDELFQEKTKSEESPAIEEDEEENSALEEFLSAYNFDEDEEGEEEEESGGFDEELYEKYIQDGNLKFSGDDIDKINKLLNSEINDDTLRNIKEYALPSPQEEKKRSQEEILADLVTTYAIDQNITFTKEDIDALNKLISVELDDDFITDLKTDPGLLKTKAEEIVNENEKPHKTSELLTLNVKDMLPDLSEALKKQGGRRIESEVKPSVVYYSEGYDVSILSLKDKLPDLSIELHNKDAYKSRPSDEIEYAESGYDVAQMHIANELPDLRDALKHPEKYEKKPEKAVVADEETLLKNITNVSFKPFYDGSESFEVVNQFDDSNAPSVSDVQKEFSQFGDLEIVREDDYDVPVNADKEYDDFVSLYDNKYLDFDKPTFLNNSDKTPEELDKELDDMIREESQKNIRKRDEDTEKLLKSIQEKQTEEPEEEPVSTEPEPVTIEKTCVMDGVKYDIVSEVDFNDKIRCCLGKNSDGYTVIGFNGDNTFKMKQYDSLNTEKIKARASEKLDDYSTRYIVRVDSHKFIVNVSEDNLEFVMDLC